ncbi:nitroreductase family protein [uncultured Capnocytophaga sp.]|uniref:nitroreductase family protein n=1 Tax=uncultured Capnocytophaga sp. TaxID=159273 RepID=UPI002615B5D7|nr:nitroreductase family protein [uncultured Capnocytophaga sp.]
MIKAFKKLVPTYVKYLYRAIPDYYYDLKRFYKYASNQGVKDSEEKYIGHIVKRYHVIEKGLTMPSPRLGFGKEVVLDLINLCNQYIDIYGTTNVQLHNAIAVLLAYIEFHKDKSFTIAENIVTAIKLLSQRVNNSDVLPQQQIHITKEEYFNDINKSFEAFSNSRKSVRNYASKDLPIEKILKAIELARNTPTSCNRQSNRIYIYTNQQKIQEILKLQGGSRGFLGLANKLIIVTNELGVYESTRERKQGYIDGGIYTMNLLYALHYNKVVCCVLNCGTTKANDLKIRSLISIRDSEELIVMIACGEAVENFEIASSPRIPTENFIKIIE